MKELEIKLLESQISANKERQRTDEMFLRQNVRVGHVEDRVSFVEEEVSIQRAQTVKIARTQDQFARRLNRTEVKLDRQSRCNTNFANRIEQLTEQVEALTPFRGRGRGGVRFALQGGEYDNCPRSCLTFSDFVCPTRTQLTLMFYVFTSYFPSSLS